MRRALHILTLLLPLSACSEATSSPPGSGGGGAGGSTPDARLPGTAIDVTVPQAGRAFVKLAPPGIASPSDDGSTSTDWDLAFEGFDIYTNGGASGAGMGGAFGPLDAATFLDDTAPTVPFLQEDAPGGAFVDWYLYDGAAHVIWSRFHVFGVRDGDRRWKVQILGYYGEAAGAPVSGLYQVRYAEVTEAGAGPTQTLKDVDGTAGGSSPPPTATSACLDLDAGQVAQITPADALKSSAWHLCFRRSEVTVNGGKGGPRGVTAADLDATASASETLEQVKALTADAALPRFEQVTHAALTDPKVIYRGDGIVTAFSDHWIDRSKTPITPSDATWLVRSADGEQTHMVIFEGFQGASDASPGTVSLRAKVAQ